MIFVDHGERHRSEHRQRRKGASNDSQDAAATGLLRLALQLAFEFALGCCTALFIGRHALRLMEDASFLVK